VLQIFKRGQHRDQY